MIMHQSFLIPGPMLNAFFWAQELERSWKASGFRVDHVALISRRSFQEPFRIRWQLPLRGVSCTGAAELGSRDDSLEELCSAPREVNVPYVAS